MLLLLLLLSLLSLPAAAWNASESVNVTSFDSDFRSSNADQNFTCPAMCTCSKVDYVSHKFSVTCVGSKVRNFPSLSWHDLQLVEILVLTNTTVTTVDPTRLFVSVVKLILDGSRMSVLPPLEVTFPSMKQVKIVRSQLRAVENLNLEQSFLQKADFSSNLLQAFQSTTSISLESLILRGNKLTSVSNIDSRMKCLRHLDAADNLLTSHSVSVWSPPRWLESLNLAGNRISESNFSFLLGLKELQKLDISGNQLKQLHLAEHLPDSLWQLLAANNPFECSCDLFRQKGLLASAGIIFADSPTCIDASEADHLLAQLGNEFCDPVTTRGSASSAPSVTEASVLPVLPIVLAAAVVALAATLAVALRVRRRKAEGFYADASNASADANPYAVGNSHLSAASQLSVASARSLPYAVDARRSRVFTKKPQRSRSEQALASRIQQQQQQPPALPPRSEEMDEYDCIDDASLPPPGYLEMR